MNKKEKIVLAAQERCTGCGACANICPKKAIQMVPDEEGFIQPQIDDDLCIQCGLCTKSCPVIHPKYVNRVVDSCYAMWAQDDIRAITSTAGFFFLLAQDTIKQGGVVYGAAWTKEWSVHHIGVKDEKNLLRLCGSKYLQSDIENSYKSAKKELESGRSVLFSGCPCQIAGLYGFLGGKEYANLVTMEVICHGVPSPEAFQKYLADNFSDKQIDKIDFRDKTIFHWSTTSNIHFVDNTSYRKDEKNDSFYRAFLPCMILRKSCSVCPFSRLPRQADISVGDFWGIKAADATWHDKKGTELVLLNNKKGKVTFERLKPNFQRFEKFPLEAATRVNKTILQPFHAHPGRKHFFSSMRLLPFNQLVENSLEHKYDIGVVGLWYGINYGSILTYYALYQLLRDLGYDPVMLPKPPQLWEEKFNNPNTIAQKFIWKHCNVFNKINSVGEINRMNDRCKDFILGSDVVWSYRIVGKDTDQFFFLDWVESGHKRIAFASSFGNNLRGPDNYKEKAIYHLKNFDAISVREDSGVEAAKNLTGRKDIEHVLDPVFLCRKEVFDQAALEASCKVEKPFIFSYLLKKEASEDKKRILEALKNELKIDAKICGNPNNLAVSKQTYGEDVLPVISVETWLWNIQNCEMYIGDSYHGLCFALLYHKPFLITYGKKSDITTHQRFESLLRLCNLEDRILYGKEMNTQRALEIFHSPINWEDVESRLDEYRHSSTEWIKKVLDKPLHPVTEKDYIADQWKRTLSEQRIEIDLLKKEIQHLTLPIPIYRRVMNKLKKAVQYYRKNGIKQTVKKVTRYLKKKFL